MTTEPRATEAATLHYSVRAVRMGATLVCEHILAGGPPTGDVTLRAPEGSAWNYVRLCDLCTRLSKVPGGLLVMLPKAPETPKTRTYTSLDNYVDQRCKE